MLPSPLSIVSKDEDNVTVAVLAYERKSPTEPVYLGPNHSNSAGTKDTLSVRTKGPKATPTYRGNIRGIAQFVGTVTTGTDTTGEIIIEVNTLVPVGASQTAVNNELYKAAAFIKSEHFRIDVLSRGES
jgi:hypothetical protein